MSPAPRRAMGSELAEWSALPARSIAAPSPDERRAAIERLLAWAEAGGARWDGIVVQVDTAGQASVRACRTIAPGEPILTLPRRLMIVDNELAASTTGDLGFDGAHPRDGLAAWLPLEAREPMSRWRAYLDALPVQLAELPMFHDVDDLAALAGTTAYAIAAEDNRDVLATYGQLSFELRARLSLADFAWGCAIVKSRAFHAPGTLEHRIALLPVVDLFDHRRGDTTWSYDPVDGSYVVSTERAFAIGEQVHFDYGGRSNSHLFVHFGFTLPHNAADEAGLLFDRAPDSANEIAAARSSAVPLGALTRLRVACILDHRFVRALFLARLQASGAVERARAVEAGLVADGDVPWVGGALEEAAFAILAAAARRALAELDACPPHATDSMWGRSCAIVRDAERAVLEQILELARMVVDYLYWEDPARLRAAASAVSARCLREYLEALADELEG